MYQIEDIIERIISNLTDKDIHAQLLPSIVDELGPEIGITGGRLWELRGTDYVLIQKHRGKKDVPLGFRIPDTYPPIQILRKEGCVYHEREDQMLDQNLEDELGVEDFVAVAIGIDAAYIASFDTATKIDVGEQSKLLAKQQRTLRRIARATAIALNNAYRHQQALRERDLAYRMLLDMLPDAPPHFGDFDIYGKIVFSTQVGGDYFNFIRLPNGNLNLVIADAKGHGLKAAATMSLLHNALLRSMVRADAQINEVVTRLNRKLLKRTSDDNFVTMSYGELSLDGTLSYCNAGQIPPLLFDERGVTELTVGGPILGVLDSIPYPIGRVTLGHGSVLIQYTDGIVEAANREGELFGTERLIEIVQKHHRCNAEEIANEILEAANQFSGVPMDDMTVVVVKSTG